MQCVYERRTCPFKLTCEYIMQMSSGVTIDKVGSPYSLYLDIMLVHRYSFQLQYQIVKQKLKAKYKLEA